MNGEFVMMGLAQGEYYAVEDVAAALWRHLAEPRDLDSLCALVAEEYDVTPDTCGPAASPRSSTTSTPGAWSGPSAEQDRDPRRSSAQASARSSAAATCSVVHGNTGISESACRMSSSSSEQPRMTPPAPASHSSLIMPTTERRES